MSPAERGWARGYLLALRPHHWTKNLLVFAPLVAAHETRPELYLAAAGAFAALAAAASGAYLLNDVVDLPHDRQHPARRHRPLAAGLIAPGPAVAASGVLATGGVTLGFALAPELGLCILLYVLAAGGYSLALKRWLFADVVALAVLFTLRVIAGGVAAAIPLSPQFLAFSLFVFLALAIVKRLSDLHVLRAAGIDVAGGRAYAAGDLIVLAGLGGAASFTAVTVLALYIATPGVSERYARPDMLWLICLLLLCWLGRLLLLAGRGAVGGDPLVFALRDRGSRLAGGAMLAAFAGAL